MASSSANSGSDNGNESLLSSILSASNSFECLSLPLRLHAPSVVRKQFLQLSIKVHPDKNSHELAKEAFQELSSSFEILYDEQSQRKHLEEVLAQKQEEKTKQKPASTANKTTSKKRKPEWKQQQQAQKKKKAATPVYKRWEDVVADLRKREELEKEFVRRQSDERLERRVKGLTWKAMKICRSLDERAGCPPTFVNGLWAPLYEQEAIKLAGRLPEGWEKVYRRNEEITVYRNIRTGEETQQNPDPKVEALVQKARAAEATNKFRFRGQTREFLGEIVEYLREDHDYFDMDDDMQELEEDEKARSTTNSSEADYDY